MVLQMKSLKLVGESPLRCKLRCNFCPSVHSSSRPPASTKVSTSKRSDPESKNFFKEVGLLTIDEYIEKRRDKVAEYIAIRPAFDFCVNERRMRGTHHTKKYWWE